MTLAEPSLIGKKTDKLRVAVLMGGTSSEREVSLITGGKIADALKAKGYTALPIDVDDRVVESLRECGPDVVFIALHGSPGEDGTIQGMLETIGLPYVGSGVLASALGMDKERCKIFFSAMGMPAPFHLPINFTYLQGKGLEAITREIMDSLGLPVVIKPSREGSAVGVSIVRDIEGVRRALDEALDKKWDLLAEEYIRGREITVGLLGNENPVALPIVEIISENEFYDYEAKYEGKSRHVVPADLGEEIALAATRYAVIAHRSLGCRGMSRVDFMVGEEDQIPYVLEINTIPGMTPTSLYPEAASAAGISFEDLVMKLVELALEK